MDEVKLHEFMGKLVGDMGGAAIMANVILGDELGLYRAMADGNAVTPEHLAERTGCNARLVREWLSAQAASGYVEHDQGRFRLPEEQAMALANEDSPVYVAGGAVVLASMYLDKDKLVAAMRGNGALSWADHHPCLFSGTERFFRPGYRANLVSAWLPALDGVVPRLEQGAKVADIGCGHGASTVIMAQAYPNSIFHGFDFHGRSIEQARQRAADAAVGERVQFTQAAARGFPGQRLRPDLLLRLPARHGRPGRRGPACARGAEARWHRAPGRTLRQRRTRPEPQSRGPVVLRSFDLHLHAQLAVAGGRAGPGCAGWRTPAEARVRRRRLLHLPPRDRDPVQSRARGAQVALRQDSGRANDLRQS